MAGENRLRIPPVALAIILFAAALPVAALNVRERLQQAEAKINAEQFAAAEAILLEARKIEPQNAEVLYRIAYVRYRLRKLAAARAGFAQVVKSAPPAYYSRYFLGRISLIENKPREAITWLEPIIADKQAVFDTASQLATAYARAGMREKAAGTLQLAISDAPWDASLYYRLGRLHAEAGRKELAAEAYDNSKRLTNATREDVETLMRVSQLLAGGKADAAVAAGSQIRNRQDADPNALVALGVIYGNADRPGEALDVFQRAASRDLQFFQAHYNHGLALLKLNRPSEALEPLARAVRLLPQSMEANRAYGLAAVMNQRYSEAIEPLERVWQSDATNARTGALLATAYLRTGAAKKAAALLSEAPLRGAGEPAPLLLRVEAMNAAEDPEGALVAAREAVERFPGLPQTHMAAAQQLARLGRYQEAQPAFAEVLKISPGNPAAELGLADTLSRSGDHAAALDHYRNAVTNQSTALAARSGLARTLIALRRFDDARQTLEESVAAYPSDAGLRIELSRVYARLGKPELAAEQASIVEKLRAEGKRP